MTVQAMVTNDTVLVVENKLLLAHMLITGD